jgi:hypothetical protein
VANQKIDRVEFPSYLRYLADKYTSALNGEMRKCLVEENERQLRNKKKYPIQTLGIGLLFSTGLLSVITSFSFHDAYPVTTSFLTLFGVLSMLAGVTLGGRVLQALALPYTLWKARKNLEPFKNEKRTTYEENVIIDQECKMAYVAYVATRTLNRLIDEYDFKRRKNDHGLADQDIDEVERLLLNASRSLLKEIDFIQTLRQHNDRGGWSPDIEPDIFSAMEELSETTRDGLYRAQAELEVMGPGEINPDALDRTLAMQSLNDELDGAGAILRRVREAKIAQ